METNCPGGPVERLVGRLPLAHGRNGARQTWGSVALAIGLWFLWQWATGRLVTWK